MLAIICILGSLAIALFALVVIFEGDADSVLAGFAVLSVVIISNILPVFMHISDISTVRTASAFIKVRQEAITEIDAQLSKIDVPSALLNADTPAASYIETKSQYIKDITETKISIEESKKSIIARSLGTSAWVVWVLGEE